MTYTTERHIQILMNKGFACMNAEISKVFGTEIVTAVRPTDRGNIEIAWGDNMTARVQKPNGTVKWLYEKSDAQVARALQQTIEANTDTRRYCGIDENF